jgi:hypothetical protein
MVLQRQLAQEHPRRRPWLPSRRRGGRTIVALRGWRSLLRTPTARLLRLGALGVAATLAARGAWSGTTPLVVVAGLASYVAGLDAMEALAQEIDHPTVTELAAVDRGKVLVRHLPVPALTMVAVGLLGVLALALSGLDRAGWQVTAIALVPAALAGAAGAAISTVKGAPDPFSTTTAMLPPEAAGMRMLTQATWPPAVATIGFLPVVLAADASRRGLDPVGTAAAATVPVVVLLVLVAGWVRVRDDIGQWWRHSTASMSGRPTDATPEPG